MGSGSKLILPFVLGMFSGHKGGAKVSIRSYKIEQKKQHTELSKRQIQKMKGKKARKNRGRKRI